jgi:acetylornithine aminotransferase/acetylornithine/N-succinyldiaminopimelate aminotransferase
MTQMLDEIQALESKHILGTYQRFPVVFVRGSGSILYDANGKEYLDLISGIGVASLGHAHPGIAAAVSEQAATLLQTSNLYYHPLQAAAAEQLAALSGLERVFFCNSGTEAVEACLKFARRYWYTQGIKDRSGYVALERGFSGRTFGALSVTHDPHYREPFAPLLGPVTFLDPTKPETVATAINQTTAAVIIEPIQGEGGVRPLSEAFAKALTDTCHRTGTLLIADEVQSGLGRTGVGFGFEHLNLRPDLVSVGKALGGGVPIGAALLSETVAKAISPGDHGSTHGGNVLSCRAALVFLKELMEHGLIERVRESGLYLERLLRALAARHPIITEIRGAGLMWGLELTTDATPVVMSALDQGVLINRTDTRVVRLLPPLTIETTELDRAVEVLDKALAAVVVEISS